MAETRVLFWAVHSRAELELREDEPTEDHFVQLEGVTWDDYERLLEIRGDSSVPRVTYIEGVVELMSPSIDHEHINSVIGRLLETYCLERGIRFTGYGSWTVKQRRVRRGAEADECYVFGVTRQKKPRRPDLAIEVVWTSGGLDKLDVWRKLGVPEVWFWQKGRIQPYVLAASDTKPSNEASGFPTSISTSS
jgi:Uma2 family endonuclease